MNTSRFDHDRRSGVTVDPGDQKYSKWIRVSRIGESLLRESAVSRPKKIFAIVTSLRPADVGCKTVRRIVIFDNHPDSLRLVLQSCVDLHRDDAATRREKRTSIICGSILIAMVLGAMLWPLLW